MRLKRSQLKALIRDRILRMERRTKALKILRENGDIQVKRKFK